MGRIVSNQATVAAVVRDCTWTFVEAMIADNCAIVEAMIANNSLPPLPPLPPLSPSLLLSRMSVAAKVASNLAVSAANVTDASTLPAAEEMTAGNWSVVAATTGNTSYSATTVRRMEMVLAASAGRKTEFVDVMTANNSDRVAESGMCLEVAAMTASSSQDAFAEMIVGRNLAVEETFARTH